MIASAAVSPTSSWTVPAVRITDRPRFAWRGRPPRRLPPFLPRRVRQALPRRDGPAQDEHVPMAPDRRPGLADRDQEVPAADRSRGLARRPGGQALERPAAARRRARRRPTAASTPRTTSARSSPTPRRAASPSSPRSRCPATASPPWPPIPQFSCTGGPFTVLPGGVWPITERLLPGERRDLRLPPGRAGRSHRPLPLGIHPHRRRRGGQGELEEMPQVPGPDGRGRPEDRGGAAELVHQAHREDSSTRRARSSSAGTRSSKGGLAPNAAVMSWRGTEGGIAAARPATTSS